MEIDVGSAGNLEEYNPHPIELAEAICSDDTVEVISYLQATSTWAAGKPYRDGFYWVKRRITTPEFSVIRVITGAAMFIGSDSVVLIDEIDDDLLFFGPILPPE